MAFLGTLVVEAPIVVLGLRRSMAPWRALVVAVTVNVVTHPPAWSLTARSRTWTTYAVVEVAVWLVEGALVAGILRRVSGRWRVAEALVLTLVANATSAALGLVLFD